MATPDRQFFDIEFGMNQILLQIKNFLRTTFKVSDDYRAMDSVLILGGKRLSDNFNSSNIKKFLSIFFRFKKRGSKFYFSHLLIEFHF